MPVLVLNRSVGARRQLGAYLSMTTAGVWDAIFATACEDSQVLRSVCRWLGVQFRRLELGVDELSSVVGWRTSVGVGCSRIRHRPAPPLAAEAHAMAGEVVLVKLNHDKCCYGLLVNKHYSSFLFEKACLLELRCIARCTVSVIDRVVRRKERSTNTLLPSCSISFSLTQTL